MNEDLQIKELKSILKNPAKQSLRLGKKIETGIITSQQLNLFLEFLLKNNGNKYVNHIEKTELDFQKNYDYL